jgi:hypothetical protein
MPKTSSLALVSLAVLGCFAPQAVSARDAARPSASATQQAPHAIPNPYAAPVTAAPPPGDRAADAYATGFAIGLGTALINKQREDDLKRQQKAK